jgi:hypothetical protein
MFFFACVSVIRGIAQVSKHLRQFKLKLFFCSTINLFNIIAYHRKRNQSKINFIPHHRNQSQQIIVLYLLGNGIIALTNRIFPVEEILNAGN